MRQLRTSYNQDKLNALCAKKQSELRNSTRLGLRLKGLRRLKIECVEEYNKASREDDVALSQEEKRKKNSRLSRACFAKQVKWVIRMV